MLLNMETGNEKQLNPDHLSIRGKSVLIVGGATEVGRATASLLAGRGARVFVTARSSTELSGILTDVCQFGSEVHGMVVSLDRPEEIRQLFKEAVRRLGGIDILINHFDMLQFDPKVDPSTSQNWCTEEAIAHMQARGKGHIINIHLAASQQPFIPVTAVKTLSTVAAALRRQANELGIRMTTVEAGNGTSRSVELEAVAPQPNDIARCIYDSIVQPFSVDLVLVNGYKQNRQN